MAGSINITQKDVDAVGSFVEAATELDFEPFFGQDEQFSMSNPLEHPTTFYLGDRFQFRSALISFRRMWMPSEPSSWRNVVEILMRNGMPAQLSSNASVQSRMIDVLILKEADFLKGVTGTEVIDLWLNAVFAHGGIAGRTKRQDFEAISDKYGQGRFEYSFRMLVRQVGEAFRHVSTASAKPAIDFFSDQFSLSRLFEWTRHLAQNEEK